MNSSADLDDMSTAACVGTPLREAEFSKLASVSSSMPDQEEVGLFRGIVWVFANISGLITVNPDGKIHSINDNFALMLFGYRREELIGRVS